MKKAIFIFTASLLYTQVYGMEKLPSLPVPSPFSIIPTPSSIESNKCRDFTLFKIWDASSRSGSVLPIQQENSEHLKTYVQLQKQETETVFAKLIAETNTTEKNGTHSVENKKALIEQKHRS